MAIVWNTLHPLPQPCASVPLWLCSALHGTTTTPSRPSVRTPRTKAPSSRLSASVSANCPGPYTALLRPPVSNPPLPPHPPATQHVGVAPADFTCWCHIWLYKHSPRVLWADLSRSLCARSLGCKVKYRDSQIYLYSQHNIHSTLCFNREFKIILTFTLMTQLPCLV